MTNLTNHSSISHKLLQISVEKQVSAKLGGLVHDLDSFIKDREMSGAEKKEAVLMILEMMEIASRNFFIKMEKRIQSKASSV